ncbi:MAG: acylphosphatase [Patescibacteria group bacterium UBA2163]
MAKGVSLSATVVGEVQGVFFRDFVQREARNLGVVGEVMNKEDGSVFVYAESDRDRLQTLLGHLEEGSSQAVVHTVESEWGLATGIHTDFIIRYS